jgi:bifunctional DNase/RNase
MEEAEIWGIAETGDGYMVFIRPLNSDYSVPIFIGQLEAQAILIGFGGISIPRPLTIDLFLGVIRQADFELRRVEISELRDNTFYARLVFAGKEEVPAQKNREAVAAEADRIGEEFTLDARPSDALALAVRCKCPVYIADAVVKEAGILPEVPEEARTTEEPAEARTAEEPEEEPAGNLETRKKVLKTELETAVAAENYERAAEIRDMLNLMDQTEKNS